MEIVLSVPPTVLLLVAPATFTANVEIANAVVNVLFISYTSSSNSFIIVSTVVIAGRLSLSGTSVNAFRLSIYASKYSANALLPSTFVGL